MLAAEAAVAQLVREIPLDLWLVTHVDGDRQEVIAASGRWADLAPQGTAFRWQESLCLRMGAGLGPRCAPSLSDVPLRLTANTGQLGGIEAYLGVPLLRADDRLFGTLCGVAGAAQPAALADSLELVQLIGRMLSTILARELVAHERSQDAARAYALAERDGLTGLHNARGWDVVTTREEEWCRRYGSAAGVVTVCLAEGRAGGAGSGAAPRAEPDPDARARAVRRCADVLAAACRPTDLVARSTSEEFAVLAVECDALCVRALVQQVRQELRSAGIRAFVAGASRRAGEDLDSTWQRSRRLMTAEGSRAERARALRARRAGPRPAAPGTADR